VIIAVVNEILFQQVIEQAAQDEKKDCLVITEEEALLAALQEDTPEVIVIDLGISSLDGPSFIQKLKQNPSTRGIPIVAFGNQIRADLLQDAKEMGAELTLPKSAFREQVTGIIRHYCR
jgi:CheY-like chemotaxis protein